MLSQLTHLIPDLQNCPVREVFSTSIPRYRLLDDNT